MELSRLLPSSLKKSGRVVLMSDLTNRRRTTKAGRSSSLMQAHYLSLPAFGFVATIGPIIFQDELPERRRQIAAMPAAVNRSYNVLYARLVPGGNVLQSSPKGFLEADACPVTGDHDRPFNDRRFHRLFSIPVRLCGTSLELRCKWPLVSTRSVDG